MPRFNVNAPDGSIIPVDAPEGATEQDAIAFAASTYKPAESLASRVSRIPGAVTTAPAAQSERPLQDIAGGIIETPMALASGLVGGVVRPIAGMVGELSSPARQGSPEATAAGERAMQQVSRGLFTPRTQTGQDIMGGIGSAMQYVAGGLPMQPIGTLTATANALAAPAMRQAGAAAAPMVRQATAPIVNALTRQGPQMPGMGAANTAEDLMRAERLQRLNIPATLGERTKNLPQQQFESRAQLGSIPGLGDEAKTVVQEQMAAFRTNQKQSIINNFERMTDETGAQVVEPRQVGRIVDKALNDQYTKKYEAYKALYTQADNAGETLQSVPYQSLLDYINTKTPTARKTLDPILDSVAESLAMNDPGKTGQITVRALEDIYQQIGKVKNSASAGELKSIITDMGEGAGGELYQAARQARKQLAREFEDVSRVDKLLGTKAGYADRRVALDDVFKHVVLDGSLEEMRTVTTLLKKGGPAGRQAYAELQGQTIQQMKDLLTKGDAMSFKSLNTLINQLDSEDKLSYMFGKAGRDQILDLRDAIKDVVVKQPGAVNYSGSGGVVTQGLDSLAKIRFPFAKTAAEIARTREVKGKVTKALQQPTNQLAPVVPPVNNLAP
jgi:hypothetical protein